MSNFIRYPVNGSSVFRYLRPSLLIEGKLVVSWNLDPSFRDPLPYTFSLEYNENYNDPDTWTPTGITVTNQLYAEWTGFTLTGKVVRGGIRVILTTPQGVYESYPVSFLNNLPPRQWHWMRTILRRHTIHARNILAYPGYLYKRKWFGPECPCRDGISREITDTYCEQCYGTGFVGGYWKAWEGRLIDISPRIQIPRRDPHLVRGPTDPQISSALYPAVVPADVEDVWIRKDIDLRYYIRMIRNRAEIAGIPIVQLLEIGPAEFTNVIYRMPVS